MRKTIEERVTNLLNYINDRGVIISWGVGNLSEELCREFKRHLTEAIEEARREWIKRLFDLAKQYDGVAEEVVVEYLAQEIKAKGASDAERK